MSSKDIPEINMFEQYDSTIQQVIDLINSQNELAFPVNAYHLNKYINEYNILVEPEAKQVIGVCRLKKLSWYAAEISHLSIHPDFQRKGWANSLLDLSHDKAKQHGCYVVQCTVRNNNAASLALFEKNNYTHVAWFKNVKTENDIVMMVKTL